MPRPIIIVPGSLHSRLLLESQQSERCLGSPLGTVAYLNWSMWKSLPAQDCWISQLALTLDGEGRFVSPAGVNISVLCGQDSNCFGSLTSLPKCDPWTCPSSSTYSAFLDVLLNATYEPGRDLFVAPFDWRHAPGRELDPYCGSLFQLVEQVALVH